MLRRSFFVPLVALMLGLAVLPACRKKPKESESGGGGAGGGLPAAAVASDYFLFAHLNGKHVRDSAIFAELKQAVTKAGGEKEWEQAEGEAAGKIGVKPSDVDAVTVCVLDAPNRGEPQFVLIVAANKPITKAGAFGLKPGAKPDAQGFYAVEGELVAHFPDDKTMAVMHKGLASKYLGGYAKDRTGWPLTSDLTKAAAGHTLFVNVDVSKLPAEAKQSPDAKDFAPLLAAKSVTLAADLKGKQLSLTGRAAFPDAAAAGRAKDKGAELVKMASAAVGQFLKSKDADLGAALPAVKAADRSLKALKLDVSGSDVTLAADYTADFDLGTVIAEAVVKVREAAARMKAQNNLKQIGLALHNHESGYQFFPIHALGANGQPAKAGEKPLLSWRVAILPYIEQDALYKQFKLNEPWDGPNNKKLIEKMPPLFVPTKPGKPGYTNLQMVVGPNALQPGRATIATFPDGLSNTIAVVEAAEPVIWTKPDDVMLPGKDLPKDLKKRFGGQFQGGFNVLMWDGSVRFISDAISDKTLGYALNPNDGQVLGSDW